jgi:hypothetical protein
MSGSAERARCERKVSETNTTLIADCGFGKKHFYKQHLVASWAAKAESEANYIEHYRRRDRARLGTAARGRRRTGAAAADDREISCC